MGSWGTLRETLKKTSRGAAREASWEASWEALRGTSRGTSRATPIETPLGVPPESSRRFNRARADAIVVVTKKGGTHVANYDIGCDAVSPNVQCLSFTGIPYATPPVSNRRLSEAEPVLGWPGELDATRTKAACPRGGSHMRMMTEDCLYLNIYTKNLIKRNNYDYEVDVDTDC